MGESDTDEDDKPLAVLKYGENGYDGAGWYYWDDEYPEEGSVGAFATREEAAAHARENEYRVGRAPMLAPPSGETCSECGAALPIAVGRYALAHAEFDGKWFCRKSCSRTAWYRRFPVEVTAPPSGEAPETLPAMLPIGSRWHDGKRWRSIPTKAYRERGNYYIWRQDDEAWEAPAKDIDWAHYRTLTGEAGGEKETENG